MSDAPPSEFPAFPGRYHRQELVAGIGSEGQAAIGRGCVFVCGAGALGSAAIDLLARAGVGHLIIADRDLVEPTNLQRQPLYAEADARAATPKALAAAARVRAINSEIRVTPHVVDVAPDSIRHLAADADVLLDGLDNFETRYLLNDLAVESGRPYIYGGAVAAEGRVLAIRPGQTPCFRCLFDRPPPPGSAATCDTAGILASASSIVAAWQVAATLQILAGRADETPGSLRSFDVWTGESRAVDVRAARRPDCPCCGNRNFPWLRGAHVTTAIALCGSGAVQLSPPAQTPESGDSDVQPAHDVLAAAAAHLAAFGDVRRNDILVRGRVPASDPAVGHHAVTVFHDGRILIHGTEDITVARSLAARFLGA